MPVEFLSDDEAAAFGRFAEDPTQAELERYFFLDDEDRKLVEQHRGQHNRLGFAVQMCTVRYLGTFLADPLMIPTAVADYLAAQLKIEDPSCLKHYAARQNTQWEHTAEIRDEFGYYDFAEKREAVRAFLLARASTRVESSKALFDAVMREQQVLLPGVSILIRLVSECREAAAANLHTTLCEGAREADAGLPERLVGLLEVPEGSRFSGLERLRRGPTRVSGRSMTDALKRAEELAELGAGAVDVSEIPVNRLEALARDGLAAKAQAIDRRDDEHKVATLVATVRSLTSSAVDDALDVFGVLVATKLIKVAERVSKETKLATLPKLSKASVTLAAACGVLLTALKEAGEHAVELGREVELDVASMVAAIDAVAPRDRLADAVATVEELAPSNDDDDAAWRAELVGRWAVVRPFLELLAKVVPFGANDNGRPVLDAARELPDLVRHKKIREDEIRSELVVGSWRKLVTGSPDIEDGYVDKHAYALCVLEALWKALRHREIYAQDSKRWGDPQARLLEGQAWERIRDKVLVGLKLTEDVDAHLAEQEAALDAAWKELALRIGSAPGAGSVHVEEGKDGRAQIRVDKLDRLEDPPSLVALRELTARMMPQIDLPELLLEIHARTGYLSEFTHASGGEARMDEAELSLAAVLVAEACNVGYKPVAREGHPALSRDRLSHTEQNYLRAETLKAANARLIDSQAEPSVMRRAR